VNKELTKSQTSNESLKSKIKKLDEDNKMNMKKIETQSDKIKKFETKSKDNKLENLTKSSEIKK